MPITLSIVPATTALHSGTGVSVPITNSPVRIFGGLVPTLTNGLGGGGYQEFGLNQITPSENTSASLDLMFNGDYLGFTALDVGGIFRAFADGIEIFPSGTASDDRINNPFVNQLGTTSNAMRVDMDFGGVAQLRHIRIDAQALVARSWVFDPKYAITVPSGNITFPPPVLNPRMIVMGDSFTEGTGTTGAFDSWAAQYGALLGRSDVWVSGSGGTGYINPGPSGSNRVKFRDRFDADVAAFSPKIVILAGGNNDPVADTAGGNALQTEAEALYTHAKSSLPDAKIYALSVLGRQDAPHVQTNAILKAAAAAVPGIIYVDLGQLFTGTGYVGSPKGDGNADTFLSSDGVHPTPAGHHYLAQQVALRTPELLIVTPPTTAPVIATTGEGGYNTLIINSIVQPLEYIDFLGGGAGSETALFSFYNSGSQPIAAGQLLSDNSVAGGDVKSYTAKFRNSAGVSPTSTEVTATTKPPPRNTVPAGLPSNAATGEPNYTPLPPLNLVVTPGNNFNDLNWQNPPLCNMIYIKRRVSVTVGPVNIGFGPNDAPIGSVTATTPGVTSTVPTTFRDMTAVNGISYDYEVYATP